MKTLVISDGKAGHVNQAKALCNIMGWQCRETVVVYTSRSAKGATYPLDWLGIRTAAPFALTPAGEEKARALADPAGGCGLIVAVGSASYYPAKVIAEKARLPVVALMYPRGFRLDFDHILCPAYDNPPARSNITTLPVTLCNRDQAFYDAMTRDFAGKFEYSLPAVAVVIGGDNKYQRICPEKIEKQLARMFELTPRHRHWVTTSRRTSKEVETIVEKFDFDYRLIYSRQQYNPIPAFINLAEYLFVTGDSASMISECVSAGSAKVEILPNVSKKKNKFDRFLVGLEEAGCVHIFDGTLGDADKKISLDSTIYDALAPLASQHGRSGGQP